MSGSIYFLIQVGRSLQASHSSASNNRVRLACRLRPTLFLLGIFFFLSSLKAQETEYDLTLLVDAKGGKGRYTSLAEAAEDALAFAADSQSVHILVAPGTYRETVKLKGDREKTYAPIFIEGSSSDDVIISGADLLNGWELNGDTFECAWPYDDSAVPHLFVQGARVQYVLGKRTPRIGQCTVRGNKIYMLPPKNAVVRDGNVEAATRPVIFVAKDLPQLTLKGLAFENGAILKEDAPAAVETQNVTQLHMEDVRIEANGYGLFIQQARELTLSGLHCLRNRLGGARLYWCSDIHILGGSFNLNGHDAPEGNKDSAGLSTRKSQGLRMERTTINENRIGLEVRYASKETYLYSLHIYLNRERNVELTAVDALDLVGGQFFSQDGAILAELTGTRGIIRNTLFVDDGGDTPLVKAEGSGKLTFNNNVVAAFDHSGPIIELGGVVELAEASGNLYYSNKTERAFTLRDEKIDFEEWSESTGQEARSLWGDPLFSNRAHFDFSLRPSSPWFKRGQ